MDVMHRRAEFACLDAERRPEVPNPKPWVASGLARRFPRPPGIVPAVAGFRVIKDIGAARKRRNGIDRLKRPLGKRCNSVLSILGPLRERDEPFLTINLVR